MADLQNFATTVGSAATVTVPTWTIAGTFTDSNTGVVIADLTGANAVQFPTVLAALTVAQRQAILDRVAEMVLKAKAGIA